MQSFSDFVDSYMKDLKDHFQSIGILFCCLDFDALSSNIVYAYHGGGETVDGSKRFPYSIDSFRSRWSLDFFTFLDATNINA